MGHAHPAASSARNCLNHNRITNFLGGPASGLFIFHHAIGPRRNGNPGASREFAARLLVAKSIHYPRPGADEGNITTLTNLGKTRVFRQKSVAWMNRIHIGNLSCSNNAISF